MSKFAGIGKVVVAYQELLEAAYIKAGGERRPQEGRFHRYSLGEVCGSISAGGLTLVCGDNLEEVGYYLSWLAAELGGRYRKRTAVALSRTSALEFVARGAALGTGLPREILEKAGVRRDHWPAITRSLSRLMDSRVSFVVNEALTLQDLSELMESSSGSAENIDILIVDSLPGIDEACLEKLSALSAVAGVGMIIGLAGTELSSDREGNCGLVRLLSSAAMTGADEDVVEVRRLKQTVVRK